MSKRDVQLNIRVTADELERIDAAAKTAGLSRTSYIIECAANGRRKFTMSDNLLGIRKRKRRGYYPNDASLWHYEGKPSGAPRKSLDGGLRSEPLFFRISKYEKRTIERRAEQDGMSITDYLLKKGVYTADEIVPFDKEAYIKTLQELRAQGRNLNQIAAALNRISSIAWRDDVDGDLIDALVRDVSEDNVRTRAGINDAYAAIQQAALGSRLKRR